MRKRFSLLYLIPLCLTLSCQPPQSPAGSIINSSSPDTQPSSQTTLISTPPNDFPRSNQQLATGQGLGLNFLLNQLDAKGNGVVIWALGNPSGQRLANFKPITPIDLGNFPTERLTWSLDAQGNGQVFRQQLGGPRNNLLSSQKDVYVFNVVNYQPQPEPIILSNMILLKLHKDSAGNGWLLTQAVPPENAPPQSSPASQPAKAHRLRNYHLVSGDTHTLPAELSVADFQLDAEGSGFAIKREDSSLSKTALWLQRLERFASVGAPEQLADKGDNWFTHVENGQGLVYWPVYNEQQRPIRYELLQVSNYLPGSRLPSIAINASEEKENMFLNLDANGNGVILWHIKRPQAGKNEPFVSYSMQAVKNFQPGQTKVYFANGDEQLSDFDMQLDKNGRGLFIWKQQPWKSVQEFFPDQAHSLWVLPIENGQPAAEPLLLSDSKQKSVESISLKLSPEGHGLISWIQYQSCEQSTCPLVRTVWARAVYNYRIPEE